jgi:hypothetical protein
MILTRRTPRLNVDNSLNSLIKIIVDHMELKDLTLTYGEKVGVAS